MIIGENSKKISKMKKIDYRFKFLYVLGTLSVVIGHTGGTINLLYDWFPFGSYFLAIFAFSSGYFFDDKKCEYAPGNYVLHKLKSLILPLYVYNTIYGVFVLITKKLDSRLEEILHLIIC